MALIKALETKFGNSAEYWRIVQFNQNVDRQDLVVDVAGYVSKDARLADAAPIEQVRFNFIPSDHPLEELDPDLVDETLMSDWRNFDQHLIYQQIKAVAAFADGRVLGDDEDYTANEQAALKFVGATDDI